MTIWVAVLLGGAIGAPARFVADRAITNRVLRAGARSQFPWGLFVVNLLGSAIAGLVLATTTGELRVLLLVGFCGAFTTLSGYAWETDRLWAVDRRSFWTAVILLPVGCTLVFLAVWRLASAGVN